MKNVQFLSLLGVMLSFISFDSYAGRCCEDFVLPPHNFAEPMSIEEAENSIREELFSRGIRHSQEALSKMLEKKPLSDAPHHESEHDAVGEITLFQAGKAPSFSCEYKSQRFCTENKDVNGSKFFLISLHGLYVATVEVGNDAYQGNRLLEFVMPLLSLSKEGILAMHAARKALYEDIAWMRENYGVTFYDPNAMPLEYRFPENQHQRLFVAMEHFTDKAWTSSHQISDCFLVKPTQFILGRSDYEDSSIYQQGDLPRLFVANKEVFEKCKLIAINNLERQTEEKQISKWSLIVKKFESSASIPDHGQEDERALHSLLPDAKKL